MKVDKLSRYGIVTRSQNGQQIPKYWVTMSVSIQQNYQFLEWIITNIQKSISFYMDNRNSNRRRNTHRNEL